ncbi:MAG: pyridoxal-dependent decarboxylase [Rickettsiales bacterium]|nr:pyridoxal-dependent decarboxylase [Rickettsiales bacterium]
MDISLFASAAVAPAAPTIHTNTHTADTTLLDARFGLSDRFIRELAPHIPVAVLQPNKLYNHARRFVAAFPGHVMYAVKCNPDDIFLNTMYEAGVHRFDAASIAEIRQIRGLFPFAHIYYMHPVKAPESIREAYHEHRVRAFVLDYEDELHKILEATDYADDLELFVRIAVPKGNVATDFSSKFGAKPDDAAPLIAAVAPHTHMLGVSFHVGTQCTNAQVYANAIAYAASTIAASGQTVHVLDVGGGFPTALADESAGLDIASFMQTIADALDTHGMQNMEILCEAGRGLVADAGSLVVRVEGRKGDLLYINDGTYGGLFEAGGSIGLPYPCRLIRKQERTSTDASLAPFRLAGPTCDSVDMMQGPYMLPNDIQVGDWITFDKLGAYGEVSRTNFNGFGETHKIVVSEHSLISHDVITQSTAIMGR